MQTRSVFAEVTRTALGRITPIYDMSRPSHPIRFYLIALIVCDSRGRGSSIGIATNYGLEGPGIEARWGRDFPHLPRPALGPTQPPIQWVPGPSREWSGRCLALAEVEGRVELYICSPSGPSWPVLGWTARVNSMWHWTSLCNFSLGFRSIYSHTFCLQYSHSVFFR